MPGDDDDDDGCDFLQEGRHHHAGDFYHVEVSPRYHSRHRDGIAWMSRHARDGF